MPFKDYSSPIADIDEATGITKGYFNAFNNKDSDGDVSIPGSFKKTVSERGPKSGKPRIKHLFNHGITVSVLQELDEDTTGLVYVSKASTCPDGQAYIHKATSGIITEHSFGYEPIKQQKQKDGSNHIFEYQMWEGSGLDKWGANMNTPLLSAKEYSVIELLAEIPKYEKALRMGTITDEAFLLIEAQLKQLQAILAEKRTTEPDHSTQPDGSALISLINDHFKLSL